MMAKTKLGGLVRQQRVKATGVDLRHSECMPSCFVNEGNLFLSHALYMHSCCMFSELAESPGDNPWDTSNQPQCMCDTCFFILSSCLFILRHHQNASCYFLPSSGQTNNRCERLERILSLHLSSSPPSLQ